MNRPRGVQSVFNAEVCCQYSRAAHYGFGAVSWWRVYTNRVITRLTQFLDIKLHWVNFHGQSPCTNWHIE